MGRLKLGEQLNALQLQIQQSRLHGFEQLGIVGGSHLSRRPLGECSKLLFQFRRALAALCMSIRVCLAPASSSLSFWSAKSRSSAAATTACDFVNTSKRWLDSSSRSL